MRSPFWRHENADITKILENKADFARIPVHSAARKSVIRQSFRTKEPPQCVTSSIFATCTDQSATKKAAIFPVSRVLPKTNETVRSTAANAWSVSEGLRSEGTARA
jgi:hypothetical protein